MAEETSETAGQAPRRPRNRVNCGRLDMRIARDGTWFYHGSPIGRKEMVKLFATILERRDDGSYWLASPAEEGIIEVEDAPFLAVELFQSGSDRDQTLSFRTNIDDTVALDAAHPLRLAEDSPSAAPQDETLRAPRDESHGLIPYLFVRKGLEARLSRAVYYELVALGVEERREGAPEYGVWSAGLFFPLGTLARD